MNVNILNTIPARRILKSGASYTEETMTLNSGQKINAKKVLERTDGGVEITAEDNNFIVVDKENADSVEYSKSQAREIVAKIQPKKRGGGCCGKK